MSGKEKSKSRRPANPGNRASAALRRAGRQLGRCAKARRSSAASSRRPGLHFRQGQIAQVRQRQPHHGEVRRVASGETDLSNGRGAFRETGCQATSAERLAGLQGGNRGDRSGHRVAGGTPRTFHIIKVPRRDPSGRIVGLYGMARDVTERKRTEEALRESEERYRAVVEDQMELICRFRLTARSPSSMKCSAVSSARRVGSCWERNGSRWPCPTMCR